MAVRVVKVGGSLFERMSLPRELAGWLDGQSPMQNVLVTGGGPWADAVRQLDQRNRLTPASAHRLAIRAMSLSAWTLSQWHPQWHHRDLWNDLCALLNTAPSPLTVVFDSAEFLALHESNLRGVRLPVGWEVTSDSIAARIAEVLAAEEFVLLKSSLTKATTVSEAARIGYVDAFFPTATDRRAAVRCVDLPGQQQIVLA
jgi:aspartokinase-like uncharacterized kinase